MTKASKVIVTCPKCNQQREVIWTHKLKHRICKECSIKRAREQLGNIMKNP